MTRKELLSMMGLVATYWPHWRLPSDTAELGVTVNAWDRLLGDVAAEAAVAAVEAYAVTGAEFAPGPGVIRRRALELASPSTVPDGDAAWAEVLEQIARVGYIGKPTFSHPAIEETVRAFGWLPLCQSETVMADRAHFLRMYANAAERATFETVAPPSVIALTEKTRAQIADAGPSHVLAPVREGLL